MRIRNPLAEDANVGATGTCGSRVSDDSRIDSSPRATDAELASLLEAWPSLPRVVKAGILAMIEAAREQSHRGQEAGD